VNGISAITISYNRLIVVPDRRSLRQNSDYTLHSQIIVKRTDVRVNARGRERDAKTREPQRSLRQKGLILRFRDDETGVHTVGSGIDGRVQCAVRVRAHIGGGGIGFPGSVPKVMV